jgi:O-antigen/teichoic acid export membrane protein
MTDARSPRSSGVGTLIGHGSIYAVGRAVQLTSAVLILPLLTRVLTPSEYGKLATALVVVQVLNVAGSAGLPVAVVLEFFTGERGPARARTLVLWTLFVALAFTVLAEAALPWWGALFSSPGILSTLRTATVIATPLAVLSAVQALLQASQRSKAYAMFTVTGTAGAQAVGLGAIWLTGPTATNFLLGMIIGTIGASLAGLLTATRAARAPLDLQLLKAGLRLGLPTVPHDLSMYLIIAGDRVILERAKGTATVGRYQVAYVIGTLGLSLISALSAAWQPLIFGAQDEVRWPLLAETTAVLYWVAALVSGFLALAAPLLLVVIASSAFAPSHLTGITVTVALSALPYTVLLSNVLAILFLRRASYLAWASPIAAVFNLALNVALVPRYGMTAAAIVTVATYGVHALLLKAKRRSLVILPRRGPSVVGSWSTGAALVALGMFLPSQGPWLAIRACAALLSLAALAALLMRTMRAEASVG